MFKPTPSVIAAQVQSLRLALVEALSLDIGPAALVGLELHLSSLARRHLAGDTIPTGFPRSTMGARAPDDPSAPTRVERDVFQRIGLDPIEADPVSERWDALWSSVAKVIVELNTMTSLRHADNMAMVPPKPIGHLAPPSCAEEGCDDPADAGRHGRCEPCDRWRTRQRERLQAQAERVELNRLRAEAFATGALPESVPASVSVSVALADVGPVPPDLIARRKARRAQTSGPGADPELAQRAIRQNQKRPPADTGRPASVAKLTEGFTAQHGSVS